jgi:phosphoglycolate phosphatase-like HAD superfamily hydrolase
MRAVCAGGMEALKRYTTVFWDFDGVIKDSVRVKSDAFAHLFAPFGDAIAARVRAHHDEHSGVSRYEKIPLYLEWACGIASATDVDRYCESFAAAVREGVIKAAWVPGAREYLEANHRRQRFVLISATPQAELEDILRELGGDCWFLEVYGAPAHKADSIRSVLKRWQLQGSEALFVGDSQADYQAAIASGVNFLLRRTAENVKLQKEYVGLQCRDFIHE